MADIKKSISSQPETTGPMVAAGNKNANSLPIGADGMRDWGFGSFDYFARCSLCCWTALCPCVVYGKNRHRLRNLQEQGAPLPGGGGRYDDHCFIYGALVPIGYRTRRPFPHRLISLILVLKLVSAMAFAGMLIPIASRHGFVAHDRYA